MAKYPSTAELYPTDSYLITRCALLREFSNFPKSLGNKNVDLLIPLYSKDVRVIGFIGNRLKMELTEDDHGIPIVIFDSGQKNTSVDIGGIQSGKQDWLPEHLRCDILLGVFPVTDAAGSGRTAVCFSEEEFKIVINKFYVIDQKHYIPYEELDDTSAIGIEPLLFIRFMHKPVIQ